MNQERLLNEYEEAVLRLIQDSSPTLEDIIVEFDGTADVSQIKAIVQALQTRNYIKVEKHLAAGVYTLGNMNDATFDDDFILTPLGKNYLVKATANFTSFSNISNSNIANQSSYIEQSIKISEQPQDIQEKIKELELAIIKKDSIGIKRTFSYIVDKSVDTAIAITTGMLLR